MTSPFYAEQANSSQTSIGFAQAGNDVARSFARLKSAAKFSMDKPAGGI